MNRIQFQKNDPEQLLKKRCEGLEKEMSSGFTAKLDMVIKNKVNVVKVKSQEKDVSFIEILTNYFNRKSPFAVIISVALMFIMVVIAGVSETGWKTKMAQTSEMDSLLAKTEAVFQDIDVSFQDFNSIDSSLDDPMVLALSIENTFRKEMASVSDLDVLLGETEQAEISADNAILDVDLVNQNEQEDKIINI